MISAATIEARVRNTISTTAYQAEGVKIKNTIQLSVPVSHGPAVVARDEAVGSGVARQHVGDAKLGHVAIVGPAARGRGLLELNTWMYFFRKRGYMKLAVFMQPQKFHCRCNQTLNLQNKVGKLNKSPTLGAVGGRVL